MFMTSDMTIAQAIRLVSKLKGQLGELQARGLTCVTFKVSEEPAFQFQKTCDDIAAVSAKLVDIQSRVAAAGATVSLTWEGNLVRLGKAVRLAQEMRSQIAWLKTLPVRAQATTTTSETEYDFAVEKHVRRDIPWTCSLPEAARAEQIQVLQDRFDALNGLIETTNHSTPLPV